MEESDHIIELEEVVAYSDKLASMAVPLFELGGQLGKHGLGGRVSKVSKVMGKVGILDECGAVER